MAARLNPYLTFNGNAREAMTFYQRVFGGDLTVSTFGEFAAQGDGDGQGPSEGADGVMHAQLETPSGLALMASDTAPGMGDATPGSTITVSLSGDDEALRSYWEGLSEGATITMPLEKQMWGDEFGMLTDRFGVPWMVNIGSTSADPEGSSEG
jgi:PhnB protein